jgi:hypothetical protein
MRPAPCHPPPAPIEVRPCATAGHAANHTALLLAAAAHSKSENSIAQQESNARITRRPATSPKITAHVSAVACMRLLDCVQLEPTPRHPAPEGRPPTSAMPRINGLRRC